MQSTLIESPQVQTPSHDHYHREPASLNPATLKVIKRDGSIANFDEHRIQTALMKAFIAVEGDNAQNSERIHHQVKSITQTICSVLNRRWLTAGVVHIENIQDMVELELMRSEAFKVARSYVLYREERKKIRAEHLTPQEGERSVQIIFDNGKKQAIGKQWLSRLIDWACTDLTGTDASKLIDDTLNNLYDGASLKDTYKALTMVARTFVETEYNYSFVTARLLLIELYHEGCQFLDIDFDMANLNLEKMYPLALKAFIKKGIELGRIDPELLNFDLDRLAKALCPTRDLSFTYLSIQTLYDRYFIHCDKIRYELPQVFYMRVAMGLAKAEKEDREGWAIRFYHTLSSFDFMSSTPTLFNSGTTRPQLSSCFLTTVPDHLDGIYSAIKDNALLSKFAGGLGNDWTPVRAMGAHIHGTNGRSLGVVPFLNVADATAVAVNQGGKRKGAVCAYLETWHMDIEEFLELRKNTGDDRRRTHDMNTANWIPDLFVERVFEDKDWTLFSPDETPDLHDLYGQSFKVAYERYEAMAEKREIRGKKIKAVTLWRKMLGMLFETGHPWFTFKDPCNIRSPQQHCGVVHSSNLCTEITLNTSAEEIAVCNLGSINMPAHMVNGKLDTEKVAQTVKLAVRMLDNVIDINYYSVPQAKHSNMLHRPIGLGIMGFQDALYEQRIAYNCQAAIDFADTSAELISYHAIKASSDLAKERGSYASYDGSLWSQGILPIDSVQLLKEQRGQYLEQDTSSTLDWDSLRKTILSQGMRNSNVLAIAPTATISNICGVAQSIEPTYQNLYVKSNMSGEFTVVNPYLVNDLKALNLWDEVMVHDLKYYDGRVSQIERIPQEIRDLYITAFEIEPKWLVDAASRRQKWLDQAQSLNLYMAEPSGKKLDLVYRMAWLRGLKTTYYLRSMGATSSEKSTIHDGALNAVSSGVSTQPTPKTCSITDPDCEACQ
jgi:ribonucleoside-diphosphate reductase alpha chain